VDELINGTTELKMQRIKKRKLLKRSVWALIFIFLLMNVVAFFHAYKFTHFSLDKTVRTKDPSKLAAGEKLATLIFGVNNPRPANNQYPSREFETVILKSNKEIECWHIPHSRSKGTVIIFHGFSGNKSSMLGRADEFYSLGYSTLLVDFMGSGGSEGSQTTIGYSEAEQVKTCFDYILNKGEKNIFLFGTSMGSVAIMKAIHDFNFNPGGIIIECPFGSMYKTVCARFKLMNAPSFPMAGLLVFWGGIQNGFWAFGHNPTKYAKEIQCPTLLLYGALDKKVGREETEEMFLNLGGKKQLIIYPNAGHENLHDHDPQAWRQSVSMFLEPN
jgi:alpha-beta hydrolase superfamily lysophospholipase